MKRLLAILCMGIPLFGWAIVPEEVPASPQTAEAVAAPTIFKGTIGSMKNYSPLGDVTLTLTPFEGGKATTVKTDSEGKFYVAAIPAGIYKVRFEKDGYEPGTYQSMLIQEGTTKNFGFLMFED